SRQVPYILVPGKLLPPEAAPRQSFLFLADSINLGLRPFHNPVSQRPLRRHLKRFGLAWQETTWVKFVTAFRSTRQVIQRWTNKRACRSSVAVSHKTNKPATDPIPLSFGASPQSNGVAMSHARSKHPPPPLRRDSRQSCYSCHDLSAAFSCGGVSILDSGSMEPPAAGATVSSAPVAVRDLRVRI